MFRLYRQVTSLIKATLSAQIVLGVTFTASPVVFSMLVLSSPVSAAEWAITPALKMSYEQNDNIRMTLQPHNSVRGSTIAPRLDMGVQSEVWGIIGTAEVARRNYTGEQGLDRDEQTFRLSSQFKTERSSFVISASSKYEALISIQQEDPDLVLVSTQKFRQTKSVKPAWTWSVTERTQLQVEYQLTGVSYVDGQSVGLYDYQWRAATATLSYFISPRDQFFVTANYSRYRVPAMSLQQQLPSQDVGLVSAVLDVDSKTPSFRVGISHTFSETMQGTLMLGQRKTSMERTVQICGPQYFSIFFVGYGCASPGSQLTHDSGTTFSGDLKKKFERLDLSIAASRDIGVSGAGTEVEADSVSLQLERPITARLRGVLSASGNKTRSIVGAASADRRQYSIQPRLEWQWTREADLSLAYNYRHLKRELETREMQSHAVYLKLIYTWQKFSISR